MTNIIMLAATADAAEQSQQQFAELPRASVGYKQLNKTIRKARPIIVVSTQLEIQLSRVRHAFSGDGTTKRVKQVGVVHYSVGPII